MTKLQSDQYFYDNINFWAGQVSHVWNPRQTGYRLELKRCPLYPSGLDGIWYVVPPDVPMNSVADRYYSHRCRLA